jgi:hypothetical protein
MLTRHMKPQFLAIVILNLATSSTIIHRSRSEIALHSEATVNKVPDTELGNIRQEGNYLEATNYSKNDLQKPMRRAHFPFMGMQLFSISASAFAI